jgi:acetyl-CoA carboxylase carboxyl transferase beta subunit
MKQDGFPLKRNYKERYDITRHSSRIRSSDVIAGVFENTEYFNSPDPSLIAAKGSIDGVDCLILGQEKRRQGKESEATGMLTAKGFAYTMDILDLAEKSKTPVISFIDTFGGDTSMESELGGQSFLISDCISRYGGVNTALISYVIGEGGSGGALALQVADRSYMLENSLYSVIAPESCCRIIFHRRLTAGENIEDTVPDALEMLRPGAEHIKEIGMIDGILPEPINGAHENYEFTIDTIKTSLTETLKDWVQTTKNGAKKLKPKLIDKLVAERRQKVLNYGMFIDTTDKLTKRKIKKSVHEKIDTIDIEREEFYMHLLMKAHMEKKGIEETELIECKKEWDVDKNLFKVKGGCGFVPYKQYVDNYYACPKCGKGEYLTVEEHIDKICDANTFEEIESDLTIHKLISKDRYYFGSYQKSLDKVTERTFSNEGLVAGSAKMNGKPIVFMVTDLKFFGGSFGAAFGEKFKRTVDFAVKNKYPVVSICASGGARMNEGPMSLAQMAKMNMAILDLKKAGVLFLSVITGPTTGGAYASYATQGDVMFGERGSLVEFAGPRVVTGAGFEVDREIVCTDSLYETGKIQHLVDRKGLKESLAYYVNIYHDMTFPSDRRITGRVNDFRKPSIPELS